MATDNNARARKTTVSSGVATKAATAKTAAKRVAKTKTTATATGVNARRAAKASTAAPSRKMDGVRTANHVEHTVDRAGVAVKAGTIKAGTKAAKPSKGALSEATVVVTGAAAAPMATEHVRPHYWDAACADLMKRDRILKKLIPQFGPAHLIARGDPFVTLARSIVGQQISVKAAQAVWDRVASACPRLTPAQFLKVGHEALAGCGLSRRKAEYILDLAGHFKSGALHVAAWSDMDDEIVIAELTQIRGIGRWTAEMFLIFNLLRPNVLPLDDIGLINAISANYFSGEPVTRSEAREVAANWEPFRSVATWYMWRSLEPLPVTY